MINPRSFSFDHVQKYFVDIFYLFLMRNSEMIILLELILVESDTSDDGFFE